MRVVAVDGPAGAGKTTFAGRLANRPSATAGADVATVHTDDVLDGWADIVTFWPRLEQWILGRCGTVSRHGSAATTGIAAVSTTSGTSCPCPTYSSSTESAPPGLPPARF